MTRQPRSTSRRPQRLLAAATLLAALAGGAGAGAQGPPAGQDRPRFQGGVDLVHLAVTVTDRSGRFVGNLRRDDFVVYDDDRPQPIELFARERVPVSLGLAIDTSGSMSGEKIVAAREALRRFLDDLTSPDDEVFVYRFGREPELVQDWTTDRTLLRERLAAIRPIGDTALYDTVVRALSRAQTGHHRKKALVVISDGNDSHSFATANDVRLAARETGVLLYAVGIGTERRPEAGRPVDPRPPSPLPPIQDPFPFPPEQARRPARPQPPAPPGPRLPFGVTPYAPDREVNAAALRDMTDESGGRTEVVRWASDLGPATARIADELNRQYTLGYVAAAPRDGRWHTIRVEVPGRDYVVRARKGYVAGGR